MNGKRIDAGHGTVCHQPDDNFGYFAWPTVGRRDDGTLMAGSSGTDPEDH
jgi:hypothetical protein